jgi:hypothetical protein
MTVKEALEGALTMLESLGIRGGDVYDNASMAIDILSKHPLSARAVMASEMPEEVAG